MDGLSTVQSSITGDWGSISDTLAEDRVPGLRREVPLCGRRSAQNKLLITFGNAMEKKNGSTHMVLVSGPSGSGKSKLVESFRDTVASTIADSSSSRRTKVWFVTGKFDQYTGRNDPYSAIITAVTNLIDMIGNDEEAKAYEDDVKEAIKDQEITFATLIPNLGVMTNTQYEITSPRPKAMDFRSFKLAFSRLIMALSRHERPLILFLDDLQWMDNASLDLLAFCLSNSRIRSSPSDRCLMLIGAIRKEDPSTLQVLERLFPRDSEDEGRVSIDQITIGNLDESEVSKMISALLDMPTSKCTSLGHLVHQKTGGNPFAVIRFLELTISEGFVKYHERDCWVWDETKIRSETNISYNVLTAAQRVLKRLPKEMKNVLIIAAFLGFEFDEHMLAELTSSPELWQLDCTNRKKLDIHQLLTDANSKGIIEAIPSPRGDEPARRYKFSHDKLQEALCDSPTDAESQHLHRVIGLHMKNAVGRPEQAFDIADHLNKAQPLLESSQDRSLVVYSNFEAAKQAISRASYLTAIQYLQLALNAQNSETKWREDYDLTLEMTSSLLEVFSASETDTNGNNLDVVVSEVIKNARTAEDSFPAKLAKMRFLASRCQNAEAIKYGIDAAKSIGEKVPKKPNILQVIGVLVRARRMLSRMTDDEVLRIPLAEEKKMQYLLQLYTTIGGHATVQGQELLGAYCMVRAASLALMHGIQPTTPLALSHFGIVEFIFKNYENAFRCGRLAVRMVDDIDLGSTAVAQVTAVGVGFLLHWIMPCGGYVVDETMRGMRIGIIGGDFEHGFFSGVASLLLELTAGVPLAVVELHGREMCAMMKEYKEQGSAELIAVMWQYCLNLMDLSEYTTTLSGHAMDETTRDDLAPATKGYEILCLGLKLQLCRIFGTDRTEEQIAKAFEKNEHFVQVSALLYDTKFNVALTWYKLARQSAKKKRKSRYLSKAGKVVKYMKKMRKIGCPNFDDALLLLKAEEAWCLKGHGNDVVVVQRLYDEAIAAASPKVHHEAIAYEQAALYLESRGEVGQSESYMKKAILKYRKWNAYAKADALEAESNGRCLSFIAKMPALYLDLPSTPRVAGGHDDSGS